MDNQLISLEKKYKEWVGLTPIMAQAPGRINFIGEHTDYNDGYVLPAAIDKYCSVVLAYNNTNQAQLWAMDLDEVVNIDLLQPLEPSEKSWANYFIGVLHGFQERGVELSGFSMAFTSNVPLGGGLSSSAALESAFGTALNELAGTSFSPIEIARIGQKAEHNFVGVKCGIMDQFASCLGKGNHAILLDCKSLEYEYIPAVFDGYKIVLFDSCVKHNLASSEYNIRRSQCEEGVKNMAESNPNLKSLRDCSLSDIELASQIMNPIVQRRCTYVIEENNRVLHAIKALRSGNIQLLGHLMNQSHIGLSNLYEVSCPELDFLQSKALENSSVMGARMMGGGFGGCTINIVKSDGIKELISEVSNSYNEQFGRKPIAYEFNISNGATILK